MAIKADFHGYPSRMAGEYGPSKQKSRLAQPCRVVATRFQMW